MFYTYFFNLKMSIQNIDKPIFKAGVIIFKDFNNVQKYLLIKSYNDYWSFPKGHLSEEEDFAIGASRELYEETSIKINPDILLNCKFKMIHRTKYFILNLNSNNKNNIPDDFTNIKIPDKNEVKCVEWKSVEEIKSLKTNYSIKVYLNLY